MNSEYTATLRNKETGAEVIVSPNEEGVIQVPEGSFELIMKDQRLPSGITIEGNLSEVAS